jgi:hypothetical protein
MSKLQAQDRNPGLNPSCTFGGRTLKAFGAAVPIEQAISPNVLLANRALYGGSFWALSLRSSSRAESMSGISLVVTSSNGWPKQRVECTLPRRCSASRRSRFSVGRM